MPTINLYSIFLLKTHTQNYQPTPLRKTMTWGWDGCPTTVRKLQQNWVICFGKGGPNNFAPVTTILGNLFWKCCL